MQLKLADYGEKKNKYSKDGQNYSANFLENDFAGGYNITLIRDDSSKIIYHSVAGHSKEQDLELFEEFIKANNFKKTWKFERFLELSKVRQQPVNEDDYPVKYFDVEGDGFLLAKDYITIVDLFDTKLDGEIFKKDEKDTLNRFDGLFDGKTYGNGRFVLIKDNDWQFFKSKYHGDKTVYSEPDIFFSLRGGLCKRFIESKDFLWRADFPILEQSEYMGNIFENPELWEKLK